MPTDEWFKENPKVSAYIPQNLNEKLTEWMKGRSIKKVSQALTAILEEYLGVVQTEPITQPVRDDRLEALEQKVESLFQIVQELRKPIQASSPKVIQTELFPVEPIEETLSDDEAIALINAKQSIDVVEEIQEDEPDEEERVEQTGLIEHEIWTTPQVVEVLGVSRGKLERWNRASTLPQTIKEHTILKWAGKQSKQPFSNLWEVKKLHSADPKTIAADPEKDASDF